MNRKLIIILLIVLTVSMFGCGKYNAFKALGVKEENVPKYKVSGEISNSQKVNNKEVKQKYISINATGKSEEDIKKMAADFIQKNPDLDLILISIKSGPKENYTVEYYANKDATDLAGVKKKIDRYPVIFFEKAKK